MVNCFLSLWLLLCLFVQPTIQVKSKHKNYSVIEGINNKEGGSIGLVMAYPTEEQALLSSASFIPNPILPWLDLSGRRFNIGKIKGVDVIYVMTGEQMVNAAITVQILVDTFNIKGIVHYGIAGSTNDSLSIGDVSVPNYVAFTGSWKWKEFHSEKSEMTELEFGAYDFPVEGENLLGKIEFTPQQVYSSGKPMRELFWLPIEPTWFTLAYNQLQDLKLQQCVNETYCLLEIPKVVYGLKASSADVFVNNAAYRQFLFSSFNISTVDEESSAIVMTSITNGVPCIVFRGVSDMAGGKRKFESVGSGSLYTLASVNALTVAIEFIALFSSAISTSTK